jgi:hypothetical protein
MENITRTIYGSYLQTCMLLGLPFSMMESSTLNEKFGIQSGVAPTAGQYPKLKYYCIGNGGHELSIGAGGRTKTDPVQHKARDAALFSHLPFVLRELTDDLGPSQRAKYALRRVETHGGKQYAAYYARRIDYTGVNAEMQVVSVDAGVTTVTPFVATTSDLNPTPPDLSPEGVNLLTGEYTAASAVNTLPFDADDMIELLNVATVLYDDEGYAIISEVGLVSGEDKMVTSPAAGSGTINFNEAICAQVNSHINVLFAAPYNGNGIEIKLDVGATEPLFNLDNL